MEELLLGLPTHEWATMRSSAAAVHAREAAEAAEGLGQGLGRGWTAHAAEKVPGGGDPRPESGAVAHP